MTNKGHLVGRRAVAESVSRGKWQLLWMVGSAVLETCDDISQVIPNHASLRMYTYTC